MNKTMFPYYFFSPTTIGKVGDWLVKVVLVLLSTTVQHRRLDNSAIRSSSDIDDNIVPLLFSVSHFSFVNTEGCGGRDPTFTWETLLCWCCCFGNVSIIFSIAYLRALRNLSAAIAPLDVPSLERIVFFSHWLDGTLLKVVFICSFYYCCSSIIPIRRKRSTLLPAVYWWWYWPSDPFPYPTQCKKSRWCNVSIHRLLG
jgi:hypothetical protein